MESKIRFVAATLTVLFTVAICAGLAEQARANNASILVGTWSGTAEDWCIPDGHGRESDGIVITDADGRGFRGYFEGEPEAVFSGITWGKNIRITEAFYSGDVLDYVTILTGKLRNDKTVMVGMGSDWTVEPDDSEPVPSVCTVYFKLTKQ